MSVFPSRYSKCSYSTNEQGTELFSYNRNERLCLHLPLLLNETAYYYATVC